MTGDKPQPKIVPESSREKSERLLPLLKQETIIDGISLEDRLEALHSAIHDGETHHDRSDSFYTLKTRTETVLKDILQLAMLDKSDEPTAYCLQQYEKLQTQARDVVGEWRSWSKQWQETLLPDQPGMRLTLDQRNTLIGDLFTNAYSVEKRDAAPLKASVDSRSNHFGIG